MNVDLIVNNVKCGISTDPDLKEMVEAFLSEQSDRRSLENKMNMFKLWMRSIDSPIGSKALAILK